MDGSFVALFLAALNESTVNPRDMAIVMMRYGLDGADATTLQEVADAFGLSRERIRQIVQRSMRRVIGKGNAGIRKQDHDDACAYLLRYIAGAVEQSEDVSDGILDFVDTELDYLPRKTHAIPLACTLYFRGKKVAFERAKTIGVEYVKRQRARKHHQRQEWQLAQLLDQVIWPPQVRTWQAEKLVGLKPQRQVNHGKGYSGRFLSKKLGRLVQYESEMEKRFLLKLEDLDTVTFYLEQPFSLDYEYAGAVRRYFPDVFFLLQDGRGIVTEIKPEHHMGLEMNLCKWAALRQYCAAKGLGLVVTEGTRSIQQLQQTAVRPAVTEVLLSTVQIGPLTWPTYDPIRQRYGIKMDELVACVLKNRLRLRLSPFSLESPASAPDAIAARDGRRITVE